MAIDGATRRRFAATIMPIHKVPIPDGVIDTYDRGHIGWIFGSHLSVTAMESLILKLRSFDLTLQPRTFALSLKKRTFDLTLKGRK